MGAVIAFFVAKSQLEDPIARIIVGLLVAVVLAIGAFYALYSVRCPECKLRWVWWALKTQPHSRWSHWLYEFTECPQCKHSRG